MVSTLEKQVNDFVYQAQQRLLFFPFASFRYIISMILSKGKTKVPPEEIKVMEKRYEKLLKQDLDNVTNGYYPRELLYQIPLIDYLPKYPVLFMDVFNMFKRSVNKNFNDLPKTIAEDDYPDYYKRNFHWQTDGYFSNHSAGLYDASVELLFLGTADIMRRQVIPPVSRYLQTLDTEPCNVRLLDIACGTGRTLLQMAKTHPNLEYVGLDLSPYYLKEARKVLTDVKKISLMHANAESMPFRNNYFDILTCVYLFHELPRKVRRTVIKEMFRSLKPGGLLVIEDSCQLAESSDMATTLSIFPQEYHEPFYKDYIRDDLNEPLTEAGFENIEVEIQYLSKVFIAHKPDK